MKEKDEAFKQTHLGDICASFQERVVEMLVTPSLNAALEHGISMIAVGGGVAANSRLREVFVERAADRSIKVFFPEFKYCTDNAAMIASAAYYRFKRGEKSDYNLMPRLICRCHETPLVIQFVGRFVVDS